MIKIHRWNCIQCDDKLFLRVDDQVPKELERLEKFYQFASMHVLKTDHEMIHKEKEEKGYNYV